MTRCSKFYECDSCVNADYDQDKCDDCEDASNYEGFDDEGEIEELSYKEFIELIKNSPSGNVNEKNNTEEMTIQEFAEYMGIAA